MDPLTADRIRARIDALRASRAQLKNLASIEHARALRLIDESGDASIRADRMEATAAERTADIDALIASLASGVEPIWTALHCNRMSMIYAPPADCDPVTGQEYGTGA